MCSQLCRRFFGDPVVWDANSRVHRTVHSSSSSNMRSAPQSSRFRTVDGGRGGGFTVRNPNSDSHMWSFSVALIVLQLLYVSRVATINWDLASFGITFSVTTPRGR